MTDFGAARAAEAAEYIRHRCPGAAPDLAIMLGSGLGDVTEALEGAKSVPFADVPGLARASVKGHAGRILIGTIPPRRVVVFEGRVHQYEGASAAAAGYPVRVAHALGADQLVLVSATGSLRTTLPPGELVLVHDHVNLSFRNPLIGAVEYGDDRFPDMSAPYDYEMLASLAGAMRTCEVDATPGVYAGVSGPSYETAAEVRMLAALGADVVGMSTVSEVIVARALGMRVAAIAVVTNFATGLSDEHLSHDGVLRAASDVGERVALVLNAFAANG